jgi:hypothetical protein
MENEIVEMNLENDVILSFDEEKTVDLDEYDVNLEYGEELAKRGIVFYFNY